ncbi:hypothetical protein [Pseudomonas sp. RW409]|uniref:beta family protein n=1 Tax=Pseudomonas sp. RW409 TaxID=2202895 RepID=UPI001304A26D|nr:hypothetical protein [Pseudomonas sp. RW409]
MPMIKWRRWEQLAIEQMDPAIKLRVCPCFEVMGSREHNNFIAKFEKSWNAPALVDYSDPEGKLSKERQLEYTVFLIAAATQKLPVTPVLSIETACSATAPFLKHIRNLGSVALRIRPKDLTLTDELISQTSTSIKKISTLNIKVKIILDIGATPKIWSSSDISTFCQQVKKLSALGIVIYFVSGAFPGTIKHLKSGTRTIARRDWALWNAINCECNGLNIGFGDYGVAPPRQPKEEFPLRRLTRTTIRYTREYDWLIISTNGRTIANSVELSKTLVDDFRKHFRAGAYSYGDMLIQNRADPYIRSEKKKGGHYHITEAWSHHIALVVREQYS